MMNQQSEVSNGPVAAAMLAAGIGCLFLGIMTCLAENVTVIGNAINFYNPVGNLTGKTWIAFLAWFISWGILASKWKDQEVNFGKVYTATLILVALGIMMTFPPFFDLL